MKIRYAPSPRGGVALIHTMETRSPGRITDPGLAMQPPLSKERSPLVFHEAPKAVNHYLGKSKDST